MEKSWDVFISHATEDKETLVAPLAKLLHKLGVRVWYDEFELKLGDSLSKSINRGLMDSSFGLVILSKAFFAKRWTEYELQSLISRVVGGEDIILPIWHNISREDILNYSLYLADIKALSSNIGIDALALEITKRIRPDLLNSYVRIQSIRSLDRESGRTVQVPLELLHPSSIRHQTLPSFLVISCRLIEEVFADVLNMDYREMVENFAKDWDYEREFVIWSAIANAYIRFIRVTGCDFRDIPKKREAVSLLLDCSTFTGAPESMLKDCKLLSAAEQQCLIEGYVHNLKHINDMVHIFNFPEDGGTVDPEAHSAQ